MLYWWGDSGLSSIPRNHILEGEPKLPHAVLWPPHRWYVEKDSHITGKHGLERRQSKAHVEAMVRSIHLECPQKTTESIRKKILIFITNLTPALGIFFPHNNIGKYVLFKSYIIIHLLLMWRAGVLHTLQPLCWRAENNLGRLGSPSKMWVLGIELRPRQVPEPTELPHQPDIYFWALKSGS